MVSFYLFILGGGDERPITAPERGSWSGMRECEDASMRLFWWSGVEIERCDKRD